jgi:hypothetical protein
MAYDITMIRMFESMPTELEEADPTFRLITHAHSIISTLWTFRALYTLRNEMWCMQGFLSAATSLLFHLQQGSAELDSFVKACQGLFEMSERMPLSLALLSVVRNLVALHRIQIPYSGQSFFSATAQRWTTAYLHNYKVLTVMKDVDGARENTKVREFTFSDLVAQVEDLGIVD